MDDQKTTGTCQSCGQVEELTPTKNGKLFCQGCMEFPGTYEDLRRSFIVDGIGWTETEVEKFYQTVKEKHDWIRENDLGL